MPFREYAAPWFTDQCPYVAKKRRLGKRFGDDHRSECRRYLDKYVLEDETADLELAKIRRGDLEDMQGRVIEEIEDRLGKGRGRNATNKVMAVVKLILRETARRGDVDTDPTVGVEDLAEKCQQPGIFTKAELDDLFPEQAMGPWENQCSKTIFLLAAATGMRRSELLALRWKYVDLENRVICIEESRGRAGTIHDPKWGHTRVTPIFLEKAITELKKLPRGIGDALVFGYDKDFLNRGTVIKAGSIRGYTWWKQQFQKAMDNKPEIDRVGRYLVPHSFRHTLASLLKGKIDDDMVQAVLGWTTGRMQRNYTHLGLDQLKQVMADASL